MSRSHSSLLEDFQQTTLSTSIFHLEQINGEYIGGMVFTQKYRAVSNVQTAAANKYNEEVQLASAMCSRTLKQLDEPFCNYYREQICVSEPNQEFQL